MLATELPAHGFDTTVLCTHRGGLIADRLRRAGVPVTVGEGSPRKWRAWVKSTKPDVLSTHFTALEPVRVLAPFAPVVESVHNMNVWFSAQDWADERVKCARATALTACSDAAAAYHRRECGPLDFTIIPNGVNSARLICVPKSAAREQLGLGADEIVFVHVGRFCIQKNLVGLVDAFAGLLDENRRVRLILVGGQDDAAYTNEVRARAGDLIRRGAIKVLPFTTDPGLVLSAADAYVSNAFFEGWTLAATEALWVGRPVILSDCGSARELIGDESQRGTLIPNPGGDPGTITWHDVRSPSAAVTARNRAAIGVAARTFAVQRDEWAARADEIAQHAREHWSAGRMVAQYAGVLRRAAAIGATKPDSRSVWDMLRRRSRALLRIRT